MTNLLHKASVIAVSFLLCSVMLSVMPVSAAENSLAVQVTEPNVLVSDDGAFTIIIELNSQAAYRTADIGLILSEDVEITSVKVDNGAKAIGPTAARGRVWFGYYVSEAYTGTTKLTVSGICKGAGDWAINVESVKIMLSDYTSVQTTCELIVKLSRNAGDPTQPPTETTAPAETTEPPATETTGERPAEDPEQPSEVTTTDPSALTPVRPTPATSSDQSDTVSDRPAASTRQPATGVTDDPSEKPDVPQTNDVNAPTLQVCCAVIAVIAASALIYISCKAKTQKENKK